MAREDNDELSRIMRYPHIIEKLCSTPWLITAPAHQSIQMLIESRLAGQAQREGEGVCGEQVELASMTIEDGIASIPISGVIGSGLSKMEKGSGAVDTGDIWNELALAESDPEVDAILLDIDSPGGMVTGTPELADRIRSVEKPIFAYTQGGANSAAYWIASAADGIYATRSAQVGSIGVYMAHHDTSAAYDNAGVKVEVIKSGALKAAGYPGTKLTDPQREQMQAEVIQIHDEFKEAVRINRNVSSDDMRGQSIPAGKALKQGLIDGIVTDKSAAVRQIKETLQMDIKEVIGRLKGNTAQAAEEAKQVIAENSALKARIETLENDVKTSEESTQKLVDAANTTISNSIEKVIAEATDQISKARCDADDRIEAMKKVVKDTKASVDKLAGQRSASELASVGHVVLSEPSNDSSDGGGSILQQMNAIKDPGQRTAFYRKNKMALVAEHAGR